MSFLFLSCLVLLYYLVLSYLVLVLALCLCLGLGLGLGSLVVSWVPALGLGPRVFVPGLHFGLYSSTLVFGFWPLGLGLWSSPLVFGLWTLDFGLWSLV